MGCDVILQVPEGISAEAKQQAHEAAVLALWEAEAISSSKAAEELGLSIHGFLDLLNRKGIPVVRKPPDLEVIRAARATLADRSS
jgi:predicted HTH domain antitoxin